MATGKLAPETIKKDSGESRYVNFSFAGDLTGTSRFLTGTPTIAEVGTSALTINNISVGGTSTFFAQCLIAGGASGTQYLLKCTASDNGSPAQTLVGYGKLLVQDDS